MQEAGQNPWGIQTYQNNLKKVLEIFTNTPG